MNARTEQLMRPAALEDCLKLVRQEGFRVSNLFHRVDGMWQANLYKHQHSHPQDFYEFAFAPSPADAVFGALVKARRGATAPAVPAPDDERVPLLAPAVLDDETYHSVRGRVLHDEDLLG